MNKAYSAWLKNVALEHFRDYVDRLKCNAQYGRCSEGTLPPENMFSHSTTLQVREEKIGFHYFYIDKERGDIVVRVTAMAYSTIKLSINIAWDEQSAGNYIEELISSIKNSYAEALVKRGR